MNLEKEYNATIVELHMCMMIREDTQKHTRLPRLFTQYPGKLRAT